MSTYILAVSSADDLRRFAEEVAPAVRELVADARGAPEQDAPHAAPAAPAVERRPRPLGGAPDAGARARSARSAPGTRRRARPAPRRTRRARYTRREQAAGRHLIDVHDALRAELAQLRDLVEQVAAGTTDPAAVRSFINRMTIRQNNWTLGAFCETYCRVVTQPPHARGPQRLPAPAPQRRRRSAPVIDRLEEEHERIADLLERVDQALVALVAAEEDGIDRVRPRDGPAHRRAALALLLRGARAGRAAGAPRLLLT